MRKTLLKFKYFSDCMQVYIPLKIEPHHSVAINGVHALLTACGNMLLLSLSCKKAFRAGIDIGIGTEIGSDEIYGPALFSAYELESKVAQYPRIVIGKKLINYLEDLSKRIPEMPNQIKIDIEWCKQIADVCLRMIKIDIDGFPYLDFLDPVFIKDWSGEFKEGFPEVFNNAFSFVENEYARFKSTQNSKLAQRYLLLHNYFLQKKRELNLLE